MFKRLFCYCYNQWLSKFVDSKDDLLVILLDKLIGSNCKYCMAVRGIMLGAGVVLCLQNSWLGLGLIALAVGFTLGERHWLCEVKPNE